MQRRSGDSLGEIEADADLGSGRHRECYAIAEDRRSRCNRDGIAAVESDRLNRRWVDTVGVDGQSQRGRADEERCGAIFVGKANADLRASDGDAHALSYGLV